MKNKISLLLSLFLLTIIFQVNINAEDLDSDIRVMSFNTTCSLCNKGIYEKFKIRKHWIVDTIKRSNADIISLQEVLTSYQLKWIVGQLGNYDVYYGKYRVFKFTDSVLLIKKNKFRVNSSGGYWLGRKGGKKFSFGWTFGLPRRVQWANLTEISTNKNFVFVGSHFDNRQENKYNSAKFVKDTFENLNLPIIFAGDTNLKTTNEGYSILNSFLDNSYDLTSNFVMVRNTNTDLNDGCNTEKGDTFPECRVDHIMTSNMDNWQISKWAIDQFKYADFKKFTSDHRAIYSDIALDN